MFSLLVAMCLGQVKPLNIPPPAERFELGSPLPGVSGVILDNYNDGMGLAQQTARAHNLQGRVMWIDGTANLGRVNSAKKIGALMQKIGSVGFNTVVFDIKPISGQVLFNSSIAPKIREWRGESLPDDFDPLPVMTHEAHLNHLQLLVSMNSFSEGHHLFAVGPGYETPERQSVLYVSAPTILFPDGTQQEVTAKASPNGLNVGKADPGAMPHLVVNDNGLVLAKNPKKWLLKPDQHFLTGIRDMDQHVQVGDTLQIVSKAAFPNTSEHNDQYPLMMNPNDLRVQDRELSIVHEVIAKYSVDGLLFDDRLRFAGMNADFSKESQVSFTQYMKKPVNFPEDVFTYTYDWNLKKGLRPGKYYDAWMLWRALQMRNWVARVHNEVKSTRPSALFGIYGGSWYGDYPAFGSNYGAPGLEAGFWFLTPSYAKTGFASMLDLLITGCYYSTPTIYDAMAEGKPIGPTVEAAGQLTNRVADDQCWSYAGIALEDFKGNPAGLLKVLQAACGATQGVMVFDLSHDVEPMWPVFARAFQFRAKPPTAEMGLLQKVRNLKLRYQQLGAKERPIVISAGSAGAGF